MRTPTTQPRYLALLAAVLVLGLAPRASAAADTGDLFNELPAVIDAAGIPGLSIAVVQHGDITARSFGVCERGENRAVVDTTAFEAASLTKPVFAYGVLRLVERGELDLDRPLTSYVDFPDIEGDERLHTITARIVLSHTTGFPNWRRNRPLTIGADPGTEFGYSGEGFLFLQKAVEQITGKSGEAFLTTEVLRPLGMTSSFLVWNDSLESRTAVGHDFLGGVRPKYKPEEFNAASSLAGSIPAGDFSSGSRSPFGQAIVAGSPGAAGIAADGRLAADSGPAPGAISVQPSPSR